MLTHLLLGLSLVAYGAAFVTYLIVFVRQNADAKRASRPILISAMGLHLLCLASIWLVRGHFPLGQAGEAILTSVLSFFLIYLVIEIRLDQPNLGVFVLGAGLVFLVFGSAQLEDQVRQPDLLRNTGYIVHALANLLGYSGLILAAIASALFLLLRHEIRAKHLGAIYQRLPPLETLDRMGFHATAMGFALMTFGVALGMFAFRSKVGTEFPVEPKVLATVAVWLINGFYLAARLLLGWKRRRAAWISLAAFAALVFSVAVAPLVGRGFHDF